MAWYRTSTISLTNGSASVVGVGTDFIGGTAVGEGLQAPDGKVYEILSIQSATALTLGSVYLGATASAQTYSIVPTQSYIRDLASQAATLVNNFASVRDNAGTGKFDKGTLALPGVSFVGDSSTGIRHTTAVADGTGALAAGSFALVAGGVDQATVDATGFIARILRLRNTAGTIISAFTSAATAARNWTFPDKDGTVAMLSDFAAPGAIGGTTPAAGSFTTLSTTGRTLIGTTADDGVNQLQVNGAIAANTFASYGVISLSADNTRAIANQVGGNANQLLLWANRYFNAGYKAASTNYSGAIEYLQTTGVWTVQTTTTTQTAGGAVVNQVTPLTVSPAGVAVTGALSSSGTVSFGSGAMALDASGYLLLGTANNPAGAQMMLTKAGGAQGFEFLPGASASRNTVLNYNRIANAYLTSGINALDHTWELSGTRAMTLNGSGRLLLNTVTDDGVNQLQVAGSAKISGTLTTNGSGANQSVFKATATGCDLLRIQTNTAGGGSYLQVTNAAESVYAPLGVYATQINLNAPVAVIGALSATTGSGSIRGLTLVGAAPTQGSMRFGSANDLYKISGGADYLGVIYDVDSALTHQFNVGGTTKATISPAGLAVAGALSATGIISPQQAAAAPAYVKGAMYFDTTLNKLRIGGATAWETVTST